MTRKFNLTYFLWRWLASFALITVTYNPTNYCFIRWAMRSEGDLPLKILLGLLIFIAFGVLFKASLNSLGKAGIIVLLVFFGILVWVLTYYGWLSLGSTSAIFWVSNIIMSLLFAIGLCWASIWKRLTGQYSVDHVDDDASE